MGESANLQAFQAELSRARKFIRGDILKGVASLCCDSPKCAAGLVCILFCEEHGSRALHSAATHFLSLERRELPEPDSIELAAGEPGRGVRGHEGGKTWQNLAPEGVVDSPAQRD